MRNRKALTRNRFDKAALQLLARRKSDGMDEDIEAIVELSAVFEAPWVVVIDERGRFPEALLDDVAAACLSAEPATLPAAEKDAWLFQISAECSSA